MTVNDLYKYCKIQLEKGNGNKEVLISTDDEANGYHTLFYQFTDNIDDIMIQKDLFHDNNDPNDVVLLG